MRTILFTIFAGAVIAVFPMAGQAVSSGSTAQPGNPRALRVQGVVNAPVAQVWRVWTTSEGAEEFFAEKANIKLAIGGPYEIQFDPRDDRSGTKGLKVLSYSPEEMISFQWNAPTQFPHVRNGGTWIVVEMRPKEKNRTLVTISHLGWKDGPEWDAAFAHFEQGWGELMKRLQQRFDEGPVDWSKERMMYQDAKGTGRSN
jgi:uncharacterized protein YndB with AHSA1/START domain